MHACDDRVRAVWTTNVVNNGCGQASGFKKATLLGSRSGGGKIGGSAGSALSDIMTREDLGMLAMSVALGVCSNSSA